MKFQLADSELVFEGLRNSGSWNGWAMPVFDVKQAGVIAQVLQELNPDTTANFDGTVFQFCISKRHESGRGCVRGAFDYGCEYWIAVNGECEVGAGSWTWDIVE